MKRFPFRSPVMRKTPFRIITDSNQYCGAVGSSDAGNRIGATHSF